MSRLEKFKPRQTSDFMSGYLDALTLVATNRLDELALLTDRDPALAETLRPIIAGRLNLTDRVLRR